VPTTTAGPATTTGPDPTSTQPPAAPCDGPTLLQAATAAFGPLPAGASLSNPTCVENYASAVLTAPGQDNALVVFQNVEGEWEGTNLGTDQVCSSADIPPELFARLNCGPWEG
jgi:hypothetical protein